MKSFFLPLFTFLLALTGQSQSLLPEGPEAAAHERGAVELVNGEAFVQ